MKKENLIFFVLVLAAALVLGTTFGIVNTLLTLHKQDKLQPVQASEPKAAINEIEPEAQAGEQPVQTSAPAGSGISLSPAEYKEIRSMFAQLGYDENNVKESVHAFQQNNQIKATGHLDTPTLDVLINQVALNKVNALMR